MNNFAVLNITYFPTPENLYLYCQTNNPCHLTCFYTEKAPGRHETSRTDRGLTLPWGAYFCFVAWQSVEQIEAGDTLTHTFFFPTWLACQTKWFAFRGTVAIVLSPSTSCIFKYHNPGQPYFCNLGFEFYPITPGVPPCWFDASSNPDPTKFVRDTTYVKEGLYSCKLIGVAWPVSTILRQDRLAGAYAGRTWKFTFNFKAWAPGYWNIHVEVTGPGGWHWSRAGETPPDWYSLSFTRALHPQAEEIHIWLRTWHAAGGSCSISWDAFSIEQAFP